MKICALTMVYRDHWALAQWYRHFSAHLGAENLYVVAHGADERISQICPGASIITVPRDQVGAFDRTRNRMLNGIQLGLSHVYDWVIRTDADELICWNPARYSGLQDILKRQKSNAVFALGMNLFEFDGEPSVEDVNVLSIRRNAIFSGHYSKAWAVRAGQDMKLHGIGVPSDMVRDVPFVLPRGVYLVHLKFANRAALAIANKHRIEMASVRAKGVPGKAWRDAELEAANFYIKASQMPLEDWDAAQAAVYKTLAKQPVRNEKSGYVRARSLRYKSRMELPRWFADLTPCDPES